MRTQLTPIFDKYDIDVVLQGHDHTYSRTYQLQGDGQEHTAYNSSNYKSDENFKAQNNCYEIVSDVKSGTVVNPQGTVYLEANSATGSKFYNLIPQPQLQAQSIQAPSSITKAYGAYSTVKNVKVK